LIRSDVSTEWSLPPSRSIFNKRRGDRKIVADEKKKGRTVMQKILGYSERGIINSLFYEIGSKSSSNKLLGELLSLAYFHAISPSFDIEDAIILIEHSFSDFGDADAVILIENAGHKQAIFIEAKVKTWEKTGWRICDEFRKFKNGTRDINVYSSNLFTQLYHKYRLVEAIKEMGIDRVSNEGVVFPNWSSKKKPRKLGNNGVVIETTKKIKNYLNETFYIGIVPDQNNRIESFVTGKLTNFGNKDELDWHWSTKTWGWLSWEKIHKFCEKSNLELTCWNFNHNKGQIY